MEPILICVDQEASFDTMKVNQSGWFGNFSGGNFRWETLAKLTR